MMKIMIIVLVAVLAIGFAHGSVIPWGLGHGAVLTAPAAVAIAPAAIAPALIAPGHGVVLGHGLLAHGHLG